MTSQEKPEVKENALQHFFVENKLVRYLRETRAELRKVRWPTREQSFTLTQVVLVVTVVMAIFLGGLDGIFYLLFQGLLEKSWLAVALSVLLVVALVFAAIWIDRSTSQREQRKSENLRSRERQA